MICDDLIASVASEHGVELRDDFDGNGVNYSSYAGRTVFFGPYTDPELKLISFFHELGHILLPEEFRKKWDYERLICEIECWNIGLEEARKEGIIFTNDAIAWGFQQALTYSGWEEREFVKDFWNERKKRLWIEKRNDATR